MTDLGDLHYFLGMKVSRSPAGRGGHKKPEPKTETKKTGTETELTETKLTEPNSG
jgi:hypothetical protein